jgi:hypothetical protein
LKNLAITLDAYWEHNRVIVQLIRPRAIIGYEQDESEFVGGWNQFASFTWHDLLTIAPWMKERVTKIIDGPGLGI